MQRRNGTPVKRTNRRTKSRGTRSSVKLKPIRNKDKAPQRNKPCPCGSGQKYKKCCGAPQLEPKRLNPYRTLAVQYTAAQRASEQKFIKQWGFTPNPAQLMGYMEGAHDELKASILRGIMNLGDNPKFHYAVEKLGRLVTPKNQRLVTAWELQEWEDTLAEFEYEHGGGVPVGHACEADAPVRPGSDEQSPEETTGGDS